MKWVITKDFIAAGEHVGIYSRDGIPALDYHQQFQLSDADGQVYYEGVADLRYTDTEEGFEPLDNFGKPNDGCTDIAYWNSSTEEWDTL